jgi:hypothetical protein
MPHGHWTTMTFSARMRANISSKRRLGGDMEVVEATVHMRPEEARQTKASARSPASGLKPL